jgi:predicted ATPase
MRIRSLTVSNVAPIAHFRAEELSDTVVLAGANGVGKTRLVEALINQFSNLSSPNIEMIIEATDRAEHDQWQKPHLDTADPRDAQLLQQTLQQNRFRRNFRSSVLYFESDRSIQQVKPFQFSWDMPDPWEENVSWNSALSGLRNRFQDTLHAIFRKIQNQRNSIAIRAQQLRKQGHRQMNLDFEDPLQPFRDAFAQLLAPKVLEDADIKNQTLRYSLDGQVFKVQCLSSGEREVLNTTFDFILRRPLHCIVFFDEPDLHLHPELSSKLIRTLKTVGEQNQFIFCTHSPDIISSSLEDSVIFVGPPKRNAANQAIRVRPTDETNEALRSLGHSVGIISLGKKIVLIEGTDASLDRRTYGQILQNRFADLVLVPSASKHAITSFKTVLSNVLDKTIWGVDFFMICDRDALPIGMEPAAVACNPDARLRVLSRYHLENYFLDAHLLAAIFREMEADDSWLTSAEQIREALRDIARSKIAYATALIVSKHFRHEVGNVDLMPKDCHGKSVEELKALFARSQNEEATRVEGALQHEAVERLVETTFDRLSRSLEDDDDVWLTEIPGKQLFSMFCSRAKIDAARLKTLYIRNGLAGETNPFEEIISIFADFSRLSFPSPSGVDGTSSVAEAGSAPGDAASASPDPLLD